MRSGATLVELIVCVVLLGIIASVVVPLVLARPTAPALSPQLRVAIARRSALERGTPVTIQWSGDSASPVTVWPDGHLTANGAPNLERLTGMADTLFVRENHLRLWTMPDTAP